MGLSNKQINKQHFPIFGVLLYLCPHPLTQNDQIWHTNTYREGHVLEGQHKYVARLSAIAEFLVS